MHLLDGIDELVEPYLAGHGGGLRHGSTLG
jgi:hypothetical protein